jgi:hypothetical protein
MSASCSELKNLVGNLYIYLPVGTKGPSNPDPRSSLCEAAAAKYSPTGAARSVQAWPDDHVDKTNVYNKRLFTSEIVASDFSLCLAFRSAHSTAILRRSDPKYS